MERRLRYRLAAAGTTAPVLQIDTHVVIDPALRSFCVTDQTVVQSVESGSFSVARSSDRVIAEAIAGQRAVFDSCEKVFVLSEWAARSVRDDYGYPLTHRCHRRRSQRR